MNNTRISILWIVNRNGIWYTLYRSKHSFFLFCFYNLSFALIIWQIYMHVMLVFNAHYLLHIKLLLYIYLEIYKCLLRNEKHKREFFKKVKQKQQKNSGIITPKKTFKKISKIQNYNTGEWLNWKWCIRRIHMSTAYTIHIETVLPKNQKINLKLQISSLSFCYFEMTIQIWMEMCIFHHSLKHIHRIWI